MNPQEKLNQLISEYYRAEGVMKACMLAVKMEFQKYSDFKVEIDTYSGDGLGLIDEEDGEVPHSLQSCIKSIEKNGILRKQDLTEHF